MTSNGTDWVVVFQSSAATTALQALRNTRRRRRFTRSTRDVFWSLGHRVATGGVYLMTWNDFEDTMSIRFGEDLVPLDPEPKKLVDNGALSGLVASSTQFYVVWLKQRPDFTIVVAGSRVSTAGALLDGNGVNISGTSTPQSNTTTSLATNGTFRRELGQATTRACASGA